MDIEDQSSSEEDILGFVNDIDKNAELDKVLMVKDKFDFIYYVNKVKGQI